MNKNMENVSDRELFSEHLDNPLIANPIQSNDWCSFAFGSRTKSNMSFTVSDLDRSVIESSIEFDKRPFGTRNHLMFVCVLHDIDQWRLVKKYGLT